MSTIGTQVSAADAQPGDIVWTSGHVSLYAGNGMVVEAQQSGVPVHYTEMWQNNPVFIRVTG
jgi:cell wall-associated NlpC family hydrolase